MDDGPNHPIAGVSPDRRDKTEPQIEVPIKPKARGSTPWGSPWGSPWECGEWAAARFVRAMQFGGCSTPEAYGIMRDRFCAHMGTGCELWDTEDVPTDRTYRNAWRRSHNGGPIWLDERKVMELDERRAWLAYERGAPHNRHRGELGASW